MQFNIRKPGKHIGPQTPEPGLIYPAMGGRRNGNSYWLVVATSQTGKTLHLLGIDPNGKVCSSASYGTHAFEDRVPIGKAKMDQLNIDVELF